MNCFQKFNFMVNTPFQYIGITLGTYLYNTANQYICVLVNLLIAKVLIWYFREVNDAWLVGWLVGWFYAYLLLLGYLMSKFFCFFCKQLYGFT